MRAIAVLAVCFCIPLASGERADAADGRRDRSQALDRSLFGGGAKYDRAEAVRRVVRRPVVPRRPYVQPDFLWWSPPWYEHGHVYVSPPVHSYQPYGVSSYAPYGVSSYRPFGVSSYRPYGVSALRPHGVSSFSQATYPTTGRVLVPAAAVRNPALMTSLLSLGLDFQTAVGVAAGFNGQQPIQQPIPNPDVLQPGVFR